MAGLDGGELSDGVFDGHARGEHCDRLRRRGRWRLIVPRQPMIICTRPLFVRYAALGDRQ